MEKYQTVNERLIRAIRNGNEEIVSELIFRYGLSYSDEWSDGYRLLCDALSNKQEIVANLLLRYGCKVNDNDNIGWCTKTPLHLAVENDFIEAVNMLLLKGAHIEAKDVNGLTPLHYAFTKGYYKIVELLLKHKADSNIKDKNGKTPLHYAASEGHYKVVDLLLKHKADVNIKDKVGKTPLHYAALEEHYKVIELLLKHKAHVNINDQDGKTPLHNAVLNKQYKVIELLLKHKADVNISDQDGKTPLHFAALYGYCDITEMQWFPDEDVRTPLHYADCKVIQLLYKHKADSIIKDRNGKTPLHYAALKGHYKTVELLLMHKTDIDVKDKDGKTPLHIAASEEHYKVIELLLMHKALVNGFDTNKTPYNVKATLKRCIVKLKTANLYDNEVNLPFMDDEINDFQNKCELEIIKMKNMKIKNTNITFYDILTKLNINTSWLKNKNVLEDFKKNYKTEFPKYAKLIGYQFRRGLKKNQLLEQSFEVCRPIFNNITPLLPDECIIEILGYLSYEDLLIIN